jgi:hypothetical protein
VPEVLGDHTQSILGALTILADLGQGSSEVVGAPALTGREVCEPSLLVLLRLALVLGDLLGDAGLVRAVYRDASSPVAEHCHGSGAVCAPTVILTC